jgi:hypothetical protein
VVLVLNEAGYWVKFDVNAVDASAQRPHGIAYAITLHAPDNERVLGFDNAHAVRSSAGPGSRAGATYDHQHRRETVKGYEYVDAFTLLSDFWREVEDYLRAKGEML